jgi:hypothetical protein
MYKEEEEVVADHVSPNSSNGISLPGTNRCTATLLASSAMKTYGNVATLTKQFATRCGFPSFVHPVFPAVSVSPSVPLPLLWIDVTLSLSCQHGNIAVTFYC